MNTKQTAHTPAFAALAHAKVPANWNLFQAHHGGWELETHFRNDARWFLVGVFGTKEAALAKIAQEGAK